MNIKSVFGLKAVKEKIKTNPRLLILSLVIIILGLFLYLFRGQLIVATVNGQPISRFTLIRELEKQAGKKALDAMITKTLILQEAKIQKISVTDVEVNNEISQIEKTITDQGQNFDQLLIDQGMTRNDLVEQIRLQKLVEKLVGKDISVSDKEVSDYFEKNKNTFPKDSKLESVKEEIRKQLEQEKLNTQIQTRVKSLQDSAKINYLFQF